MFKVNRAYKRPQVTQGKVNATLTRFLSQKKIIENIISVDYTNIYAFPRKIKRKRLISQDPDENLDSISFTRKILKPLYNVDDSS